MGALLRLVQVVFCSSGYDIFLMLQVILKDLQKVQDLRLAVDQGKHDDSKGILQLRMHVEPVEDHIRIGVPPDIDGDPHTFPG